MEFIDILPSPEMGAWLSEEFEQDFCYGAKASTYQNLVFATPPGSWALDDFNNTSVWAEQTKNLNELCHQEPFPDVILQDNFYIGPDDLFGGLTAERSAEEYDDHKFYGLPPKTLADSPIFELSPSPPESPQSQKLPTIKIKLKRVKRPKASKYHRQGKENSKKLKFEIVAPPTCIEENVIQSKKELCGPSDFPVVNDNPYSRVENEIFPNDEDFQLESISNKIIISLRDAFYTGEADNFLDELLNSTEIVDSSEFKNDLGEIELDNSPISSCSFVPSPHFDYSDVEMSPSLETIDESLLSPSKEMFKFLETDTGTSKSTENLLTKIRPKKQSNESRYLRKKEQNKQAALRYRMKKKQEDSSLSDTLKQEEEHREKLKMEFSNLKQEIHIMKNLLREAFTVKKLVPEDFFSKNNG